MAKPGKGVKDVGNYRFFIFSSTPKKVNITASSVYVPEEASRRGQGKKRSYGNVMWDPRVCRGLYVASSKNNGASSNPSSCDLPQKRKVVSQNSALIQPNPSLKRDSTNSIRGRAVSIFSTSESEQGRSVTPPPVEGRFHVTAQTDPYFEPLEDDDVPGCNAEVQTEEIRDTLFSPKIPAHLSHVNSATCEEKETQCELWDIVDMTKAIRPVSENLIRIVIEQALKEIMEEYELESLIIQQNRYKQILNNETLKGEAVRKNLMQAKALKEKDNEYRRARREHEAHHLLSVINFSSNYLLDFSEKCGEQNANDCEPVKCQFKQWLNKEAGATRVRIDVSKEITDDIINRVTKCDHDGNNGCGAPLQVPVNSVVNIGQLEPINEPELLGEFDDEDPMDFDDDASVSKKSVDSVTGSERSESRNEFDTD